MRVLHVVASVDERMGGSTRAPLTIAEHLRRFGVESHVAATTQPTDALGYLGVEYPEVHVHLFPTTLPKHNFRSPQLHSWLRKHARSFDLVDIHGVWSFPPLYAGIQASRANRPYLVRPHGSLEPYDIQKHYWQKQVYGRIVVKPWLQRSAGMLLATRREAQCAVSYGASPRRHVVPLPAQIVESHGGNGFRFRARHGIPTDAFVVLFLGRIDEKKGLQFLVPALESLILEIPPVWLAVVGNGDAKFQTSIKDLISRGPLAERATWCGFLSGDEKASAYSAANVFALPSLNENFGITVLEAVHARVPILISNEVYVHDAITSADAGIICSPTTDSVTRAIRFAWMHRGGLKDMAERATQVVRVEFSPDSATRRLVNVYECATQIARPGPSYPNTSKAQERS